MAHLISFNLHYYTHCVMFSMATWHYMVNDLVMNGNGLNDNMTI